MKNIERKLIPTPIMDSIHVIPYFSHTTDFNMNKICVHFFTLLKYSENMFLCILHFYRTTFSGSLKGILCICVNFYKFLKTDIPLSSSIHTLFFFVLFVVPRTVYITAQYSNRGLCYQLFYLPQNIYFRNPSLPSSPLPGTIPSSCLWTCSLLCEFQSWFHVIKSIK